MRNAENKKNTFILFIINIAIIGIVLLGFYFMRGNSQIVTVKTIALNVREQPTVKSKIISQVHQEDKVTIKNEKNGWYKIQLPDKSTGWVADWLIFEGKSGPFTSLPGIIKSSNTDLKKSRAEKSKTIATLKRKQAVNVTLELNGWVRIHTEDNETGWIKSSELAIRKSHYPSPKENEPLYVALDGVILRKTSNLNGESLGELDYNAKLSYVGEDKDWYHVQTKKGTLGYLQKWEVTDYQLAAKDKRPNPPMAEYAVMLDAGHGGNDPGAESNDGKVFEKNVTLATALTVRDYLEDQGFSVFMTRDKDEFVPLHQIAIKSNESRADVFISMHYDSTQQANESSGTTTFYRNTQDKKLANLINNELASQLPLNNRGFGNQDYQVLRENKKPAILIELGYMNNDTDAQYAQSKKYHTFVAKAIYSGLIEFFKPFKEETIN
ncbi:N-acetylmuramoyl-L-alanine amidase [Vagococcus vulneris]|uniref:SH3b domain-containing protein n=1 Tax=Vagococcus vulneris TaxID=1977869 RepID=A0A430A0A0_9ENTE|nr:N-acetylmuramoyl-L-alanine amidase [Vagococcus vulneris]RST99763.1 hypothetical protein CBF37_03290 [Vagococcus vulneris]